MDNCFKKTISVSKLHPTEVAFLCWMSNGVWSIPYPKIWRITQKWIQMTFLVLMKLRVLGKFWQASELLSCEVFHLSRSRISPTYLETRWNCLVGYSRQARMNGIAVQLPSPSHSTIISQLQTSVSSRHSWFREQGSKAGTFNRRDVGRVLLSLHSFLKIPDQFTVSKKTAELNFSQIINIKNKG